MEDGVMTEQRTTKTQRSLLPVRVSDDAFFHVRYGRKTADASESAFIAHTFASVRDLLAKADSARPAVYLCSKAVSGDMVVQRVACVREVPGTNMCIIDFEDGRGVIWDENTYLSSDSFYVEVGVPLSVTQFASIAARVASTGNAERETNDTVQGEG